MILFLASLVGCSEYKLDSDEEFNTVVRTECSLEPLPCNPNNTLIDDLVGSFDDETFIYGLGTIGILDVFANCHSDYTLMPHCDRGDCDPITMDLYDAGGIGFEEVFTACDDGIGEMSVERQMEIVNNARLVAERIAPLCSGVPMVPSQYDFYYNVGWSAEGYFGVVVTWVGQCEVDPSDFTHG